MKLPEFNLFSDKSARMFLIFPSICPNFHGFPKLGGGQLPPPLPRTPMVGSANQMNNGFRWYWDATI